LERRLAAILAADMVGYSRLMAADEAGTLARQNALRRELIDPKIAEYGGHLVKSTGDGVLVEFPSVVDALRCAVTVQLAMSDREAAEPEETRIAYRIGINLGDIIIEDDDIYGDGVNVAARLEALAEPGGVCVSRTVVDHVKGKVASDFEDQGEKEVKNIPEPIHVFRVLMKPEAAGESGAEAKGKVWWWRPVAVAAAVLAIAVIGIMVWQPWAPDVEPASVEKMALPLPEKPSIAVLPFDNLSADPEQAYFADGMTDDLITGLSKISSLFVISRNSTFTYKGKPVKVRQVAEELGVRYVLEGSVRRAGDEVRINAQLIDALSGFHLWAEKYDGALTDIFALQDRVVGQIVTALSINLTSAESAQKGQAETKIPQAYDAFLQGWDYYRRWTPEDFAKAIPFFEKAIELDPNYSRAYAGLAGVYWAVYELEWDVHLGLEYQTLDRAKRYLAKALEQPTSDAYEVSAYMLLSQGRNDEALAEINRAIALAPNAADHYNMRAWILIALGRAEEAERDARLAVRLDPTFNDNLRILGRALFHQERNEEAAEILERAVSRQPGYEYTYEALAAVYGHLGRIEDGKAAVEKYNEIVAKTSGNSLTLQQVETFWGGGWYDIDKTYLQQMVEGLRKAGVPEGAVVEMADVNFNDLVNRSDGIFDVEGSVKIEAAGAKALFDRGAIFIDARGSGPYSRGHIPNAINLHTNRDLTKEALSELVGLDEEVVFYCGGEDCPLSANACAKALVWGYTKVYYFAGGYPSWKKADYPIETP
jgi:TolB-like protein/class 3 adenylate cyclase/Flp pilus assembly protein TadD/rhodanese-related sulfurtransferase